MFPLNFMTGKFGCLVVQFNLIKVCVWSLLHIQIQELKKILAVMLVFGFYAVKQLCMQLLPHLV